MKQSPENITVEKPALVHGGSGLLIFIATHCAIGAVVSSFSLPVNMSSLFWAWFISTIVVTTVAVIYRGKGLLLLMIPVFVLFLFGYSSIVDGGMWVINDIFTKYSRWLPVSAPFSDTSDLIDTPGAFIAALGVIQTFLLAFSICLRRSVFLTIIVTAPLIFLTFVITDLYSDLIYMFGIIAVYLALLFSSSYSPDNYIKRGLVLMPAFAIAVMIMIIAYIFAPQGSYQREAQIAAIGNRFRTIASQMGRLGQFWQVSSSGNWGYNWHGRFEGGFWYFNTQVVNIADSGVRVFTDQSLLEVTSNEPGTFYLHGYNMSYFDGRSWRSGDNVHYYADDVLISWPSLFDDSLFLTGHDFEDPEAPVTVRAMIEQLKSHGMEKELLLEELRTLVDLDVLLDLHFPSSGLSEEHLDGQHLMIMSDMLDDEVLELMERVIELNLEITYYTSAIIRHTTGKQRFHRVDLTRTMPALIAEFYAQSNSGNVPVPAEMSIARTGDLTVGVSYKPYYGATFIGIDSISNDFNTFYKVQGSVLRLAEDVLGSDFTYGFDKDDFLDTDDHIFYLLNSITVPMEPLAYAMSSYSRNLQRSGMYTEIDPVTKQGLLQIALDAGIDPNADRAAVVDAVVKYVMSSGSYTLSPEQIPDDEDFVLYFLQESQGGYCIHFATTVTLMLRALDIPARFTSGYVVTVAPWQAGTPVVVTDRNAHAWTEVFYEDIGWLYLETTPSGGNPFIPEPTPHTPGNNETGPSGTPSGILDEDYMDEYYDDEYDPSNIDPDEPSETGPGSDSPQNLPRIPQLAINIIIIFMSLALLAVALVVRRNIMRKMRENRFHQRNRNKAVICMWRHLMKLGSKEMVVPVDIEDLALKARFSQHHITEEELLIMEKFMNRTAYEIYTGKEDLGRVWLKYIRALY